MKGKELTQFQIYANQTGFTNSNQESNSRVASFERQMSGVSTSINNTTMGGQTFEKARINMLGPENGYENVPKDLSTRSSR